MQIPQPQLISLNRKVRAFFMSQYDIKITEYGNGSVELRIYDKPLYELTEEEKDRRSKKRLESIARREEALRDEAYDLSEYYETLYENYIEFAPNKEGFSELLTIDEYIEKREEFRKRKNARDSYRRTVNAIHDISRSERWTMFYTLTFSPDVVDRSNFELCMKKANKWFNNLKRKAPELKYMFVPELHADKTNWHIHGLVCGDSGVEYVDSGKRDKSGRVIYNIGNWKYGFSTATKIDDSAKASSYILKYITKELCENSLGKKRYYHSRNINEPIVTTVSVENDMDMAFDEARLIENVDVILYSFGCDDVTRVERVCSEHCSVVYINAHKIESEEKENE